MNRRNYLQSVAGMPLLPTMTVPDQSNKVNFEYLDQLFAEDYTVEKDRDGVHGETYKVTWDADRRYHLHFRATADSDNVLNVYDNTPEEYPYTHFRYLPQNIYEAWTMTEIGRNQGIINLISVLNKLESVGVYKVDPC